MKVSDIDLLMAMWIFTNDTELCHICKNTAFR